MAFHNLPERYSRLAKNHGPWIVALAIGLAVAGYFGAGQLRVNTRLESLLPENTPTLDALDVLRDRVASDAPLTFFVASEDPALTQSLAEELREKVSEWPEVRWAITRRDPSYFLDRRLLYLPAEELENLADDVEYRIEWEECEAMPGCLSIDDKPELPTSAELQELFAAQPGVRMMAKLFGSDPSQADNLQPDAEAAEGSEERNAPLGSLCNAEGTICAVQANIDGDAGNITWATEVFQRSEALFDEVRPADAPEHLRIAISGRYRNTPLTKKAVEADLQATSVLSTVLVLLLVFLQFRGLRSIVLLIVPIAVALLTTLGILGIVHPDLNLISAFTLAILAGIGIDFGLHLMTHYGALRSEGKTPEEAVAHSLKSLSGSLLAAGATTSCAFAALAAADFRGFAEMGAMAALGVILSLLATVLLFGPLALTLDRFFPEKVSVLRRSPLEHADAPRRGVSATVALALTVLAVGAGIVGRGVDFEYDFRNLRPPNVGHGIPTGGSLHGTTGPAVYLLGDSPEAVANFTGDLDLENLPGGEGLLLTPEMLIPPEQDARLAAIARIRAAVARIKPRLEGEAAEQVAQIEPWLNVDAPIEATALPTWIADWLVEKNGAVGRLGVLYFRLRGSDAHAMETLSEQLQTWREAYPDMTFASPEAVIGEIVPGLRSDAPTIIGLALLGLALATIFFGRSLGRTLLVLSPVVLFMGLTTGAMVLFDLRLNFYNMLVLPVAFGVGVDGAVYVVWAMSDDGESTFAQRWSRFTTSARAIVGSTATTLVAFGSIMVAGNPGLKSLGILAVVAVGFSLVANILWLPNLMAWWQRRK